MESSGHWLPRWGSPRRAAVVVGLGLIASMTFAPAVSHATWSPGRSVGAGATGAVECTTPPSSAKNVLLDCRGDSVLPTNEPAIAVDPSDAKHMVVQANDFAPFAKGAPIPVQEIYTTFDGGRTWLNGDLPLPDAGRNAFDPSITFDTKHATVIAALQTGEAVGSTTCDNIQAVSVSSDGGVHWSPPVSIAVGSGCWGDSRSVLFDTTSMATDDDPSSPHYGRTYLVFGREKCFRQHCPIEVKVVARSDDGGYTWSRVQPISGSSRTYCTAFPHPPACDTALWSSVAISPDGSVHVVIWNAQNRAAWEPGEQGELQLMAVNSWDGGATWSDPLHIVDLEDGSRDYPGCVVVDRTIPECRLTGTQMASPVFGLGNLAASPIDGTLYAVFSDNRNGRHDVPHPVSSEDIFVMTSTDGGNTWAGPDLVSGSPGDEWFPHAAVNPLTGELGVAYNDRASTYAQQFTVTLATGLPGSPFTETTVTTKASSLQHSLWFPAGVPGCETCATWTGDFIGLAYGPDGAANAVWTDLRRRASYPGFGSGHTQNIFYARR